jgi:uncharacterized protein (TIGR03437 family)
MAAAALPVKGDAEWADKASRISAAQTTLRSAIADRGVAVLGATQTVLNAIYVAADAGQAEALGALPGVARVVEMQPLRRHAVKALDLVKAPQAWRNLGASNAGAGVRIAVLDTGIDHEHPAFRDPSLSMPAGFPRCAPADCAFTSNKVIAARSFVQMLVLGDDPVDSRPDDLSARDRVGHGTAVAMMAAGTRHDSPLGPISGVAPKAYLGSYKIFGSPGVNDVTFDDVVIRALDDAVRDGMHIAVLSIGRAAIWQPDDRGGTCENPANRPCDPWADAVAAAVGAGMTVVVSAGNDGDAGVYGPSYNTINTPGTVPAALTVGSSTNLQRYFSTLRAEGGASGIAPAAILFGDGPRPRPSLSAPVKNPAAAGEDGSACQHLSRGSLAGAIAIVDQGRCTFATKVNNAQLAGAVAVIVRRPEGFEGLLPMRGLEETSIPAAMIGASAGKLLREFAAANPAALVTLDATLTPVLFDEDIVSFFSSYGPSIAGGAIKPEVVAPGQAIYTATQRFDPYGNMYSEDGYIAVQGTSFAAPMAAGAAALFKQRFGDATPDQVKSAVVNTADASVDDFDNNDRLVRASVRAAGAGKIDAEAVTRTNVTAEPGVLSFGYYTRQITPRPVRVLVNNHSRSAMNLRVQVRPRIEGSARVAADQASFSVPARSSRAVVFSLSGAAPAAGVYEGDVVISGGEIPVRLPYLFISGDGATDNLIPLRGNDFVRPANSALRLLLKAVDRYGAPVGDVRIGWRATLGDGVIGRTFPTDNLGIGEANVTVGSTFGEQEFSAEWGSLAAYFQGRARLRPTIQTNGVVNAASGESGRGVSPGSMASILGRNLSDSERKASTPWLPAGLAGVSVSFDVPERRISVPGKLRSVSDSRVDVQVPWELQGLNSAILKVSIGDSQSALYTVSLDDFAPALYETTDADNGRTIARAAGEDGVAVTVAKPIGRGKVILLEANGLGPVEKLPITGDPISSDTPNPVRVLPELSIGGRPAEIQFSGLAPGIAGRYLIRARVPEDAPDGIQPVVVTSNGVRSKAVNVPIQ